MPSLTRDQLALAALACALTACSAGDNLGRSRDAIAGGSPAPDETGTVAVANFGNQGSGFCSAILAGPNLVVTARHCVSNANLAECATVNFNGASNPADLAVTGVPVVPFDGSAPPLTGVIEVVVPSPQAQGCGQDIAALILESEIVGSENVPYVPRVDVPVSDGEIYSAVGYGGTTDSTVDAGIRRRRDLLVVQCLGAECEEEGLLPSEYIGPEEFFGHTGACNGDSGGPALDDVGRVIGINSRGQDGCTTPLYTEISAWAPFLQQTALHAAEVGGYEPPAWATGAPTDPIYSAPIGAACSDGAECPAGICIDGQCSRPCTELAVCEGDWTCKDEVCVPPAEPAPPPATEEDGGCSVGTGAAPQPWRLAGWLGAALLALAWRRRRR